MTARYDVAAIGNAIVDVIAPADEGFLAAESLTKGSMMLIDEARASDLYSRMSAGIETSGGSAGNTRARGARFGGRGVYPRKGGDEHLRAGFAPHIQALRGDFY